VVCEPIYVNPAVRTALLATMPTLDNVDIIPVQRGDQSCSVVIPGAGGLVGTAGGHGRGGSLTGDHGDVPAGDGLTGSHGGIPVGGRGGVSAGGRGGGPTGGSDPTPAPGKGKQVCVILDDDEVSSDEDEPLQKRLRRLFGARLSGAASTMLDEVAAMMIAAEKEAVDKRAVDEAAVKRATEEATVKATADKEVTDKTMNEAAGATGDSPSPDQAPSVVGTKRVAAPPRQPNDPTRAFGNLGFSNLSSLSFSFFFVAGLQSDYISFSHRDGHCCFYCRYYYRRSNCWGDSRVGYWR
jgi:hypothetical protein